MKIKGRVLRFTHNGFHWCCLSSVYKAYHFVLLISRCLGIKYGDDVIKNPLPWKVLWLKSFYWAKVWIYLWNNLHKVFLVIYFLKKSWKKETYGFFHLHRYVNVLQLPIVDIAAVLYVVCKYLFTLSLDNPFLLFFFASLVNNNMIKLLLW